MDELEYATYQRDSERIARMLGADLEKGAPAEPVITREALARLLWSIDLPPAPIELAASEVTSSPLPNTR